MKISWLKRTEGKIFRLGMLLLVAIMLLGGCNSAARAKDWAKSAEQRYWQARYRIIFHQDDEDIEMTIQETGGETLVLDITMPRGSLLLEYDSDKLLLNLDGGNLHWQDIPPPIPYYTLTELAKQVNSASELASNGGWTEFMGYRVMVKKGAPIEVSYLSEWTLYVEEFKWD